MATKPKTKAASSAAKPAKGEIAYAKIFPPIGVARVGNSTESPGASATPFRPSAFPR